MVAMVMVMVVVVVFCALLHSMRWRPGGLG